MTKLTT
jgi:biopolymer transport protein ExbB/TolQ